MSPQYSAPNNSQYEAGSKPCLLLLFFGPEDGDVMFLETSVVYCGLHGLYIPVDRTLHNDICETMKSYIYQAAWCHISGRIFVNILRFQVILNIKVYTGSIANAEPYDFFLQVVWIQHKRNVG